MNSSHMTPQEIIQALTPFTGTFPEAAFRAALEQKDDITPLLLQALEEVAADPVAAAKRKDWMLPTFAIYLLAQFRERRAFPLLMRISAAPGETTCDLFGDTVSSGLCQVLASIYDGDPAPLKALVVNPQANEFARAAALDTLLVLEATGQMPRDEVVEYLRGLLRGGMPPDESYANTALVMAAGHLPAPELLPEIRAAFEAGWVDTSVVHLEHIEEDLRRPATQITDTSSGEKRLIDDAIAEVEWWACFHPEDQPEPLEDEAENLEPRAQPPPVAYQPPEPRKPFIAPDKVGRNDPCPCGSGKKYKKCCLLKV